MQLVLVLSSGALLALNQLHHALNHLHLVVLEATEGACLLLTTCHGKNDWKQLLCIIVSIFLLIHSLHDLKQHSDLILWVRLGSAEVVVDDVAELLVEQRLAEHLHQHIGAGLLCCLVLLDDLLAMLDHYCQLVDLVLELCVFLLHDRETFLELLVFILFLHSEPLSADSILDEPTKEIIVTRSNNIYVSKSIKFICFNINAESI